ncbi:antitoxin [Chitinimonas arctica]|uniref:Antitoxin n=1 Tax=Chitinimonas arctica TaxID=2594795 RepID=A0A516SM23_9NEIS|nr:antitoxin [Chitinimonas arctica]
MYFHSFPAAQWDSDEFLTSLLTIDVTEQQHQALKAAAALQGKTIKQYAVERLFPSVSDENQALDDLKALLSRRMAEAQRGDVTDRSITEVADEVLSARGPS